MQGMSKEAVLAYTPVICGRPKLRRMTVMPVAPVPLAVLVPFACNITALDDFLESIKAELMKLPGPKRISISWSSCKQNISADTTSKAVMKQRLEAWKANYSTHHISLKIVPNKFKFSRGRNLEAALTSATNLPDEVAVVLDIDMRVTWQYFLHCRALSQAGASAYFPITFSHYNPELVKEYGTFFNRTSMLKRLQQNVISQDIGLWRKFGFGMQAIATTNIAAWGWYDVSNNQWGMDDLTLFQKYSNSGKVFL